MIEAPEPPHRHVASGHKWFDIILALAVLAVSLGSLYVAYHTSYTMEKLVEQNARLVRANATPVLTFGNSNITQERKPEIRLGVTNNGSGSARLHWLEVRRDGELVQTVKDYTGVDPAQLGEDWWTGSVAILPAGEEVVLFGWPRPAANTPQRALYDAFEASRFELEVETCYCSLLDECWQDVLTNTELPKPVAMCSAEGRTPIFY